jgi:hypothetical protein
MPHNKLPEPYDKMSWAQLVATLAQELTQEKFRAEGDAIQLQAIFKQSPNKLIKAQSAYTAAAASSNGVSTYLQVILRSGSTPSGPPPDLDETRTLFQAFEEESEGLKKPMEIRRITGSVPILGDIVKVFDTIFKAIEWFKERHDKQRAEVADLLASCMWRQWDHASDPAATPKPKSDGGDATSSKPKPGAAAGSSAAT